MSGNFALVFHLCEELIIDVLWDNPSTFSQVQEEIP